MKDEKGQPKDLRSRTKRYALRIVRLYLALPKTPLAQILGRQFLKSGASAGAHYREACRAKSNADFVSRMEGALQELDESDYRLDLRVESGVMPRKRLQPLLDETNEMIAIFVAIVKRAKGSGSYA